MRFFPLPIQPVPETVRTPLYVLFILLAVTLFGMMLHPMVDPDVYIHLRDGRFWTEHGLTQTAEPFAYTASDQPMEKVEWLFRLGLYQTYRLGGYTLMIIVKAVIMTLALLLYGGLLYRRWPNLGVTLCLIGLSFLALWTRVAPERPQMFTYLLLPLVLHLLEDYRQADSAFRAPAAKRLFFIPALVLFWTNVHPGFIVVFVFMAAQAVDYGMDGLFRRDRRAILKWCCLLMIGLLTALAGAANPMGFKQYAFIFNAAGNAHFMQTIVEWMPPELARKPVFFGVCVLFWLVQLFSVRRSRFSDFLLLLIFTYLALKSRRHIPFFLIAAMPAFVSHLVYLKQLWFPQVHSNDRQRRIGLWAGATATGALLCLMTVTGYAFRTGQFPDYHPQAAVAWMNQHALQGRLFAPLHWGGYIGWVTHGERKVFMDGRLPTFAGKTFDHYQKIIYGDPGDCLRLLDDYHIQILLVSPKNYFRFFQQINQSGAWSLVYWDHVSQIFIRNDGPNFAALKNLVYRHVDPNATPFSDAAHPDLALQEIQRARKTAPHSFLPVFFEGHILLEQGQLDSARALLEQVFAEKPKHPHTLTDLGIIAYRQNRLKEAEGFFKQALAYTNEAQARAHLYLWLAQTIKENPLRRKTALHYAKKALRLLPGWQPAEHIVQELKPR